MRKHELQGSGSLPIRAPSTSRHTLLSTSALAGGAMRGFVMATGLAASASLFVTRRFRQTS
jgi:type IV secretory pathway TrbD component